VETAEKLSSPSQLENAKLAPEAGFTFLGTFGDTSETMKYKDYKPAKINKGKRWFVSYLFKDPDSKKFKRFKVYEDINRYGGEAQEDYAENLRKAVDYALKRGFNPFHKKPKIVIVVNNWTLVQGLNYFKQHLPNRGLRKRTIQSYESVLRMLYKECDTIRYENIREISKAQITSALRNAKSKGSWSNTTFNNNIAFVRAIFSFLIDEEILEFNPAGRIKSLPVNITKHKYFDDATWEKIKK